MRYGHIERKTWALLDKRKEIRYLKNAQKKRQKIQVMNENETNVTKKAMNEGNQA